MEQQPTFSCFGGSTRIAAGPLPTILVQLKRWTEAHPTETPLCFEDRNGKQIDFDLRGGEEEVVARATAPAHAGPGRPKLGVVSREITLLPRHWEWLEEQPSGASATLRRLVDEARKQAPSPKLAAEAAGRFMAAMAGNLPEYEEATRALYAGKGEVFRALVAPWPTDIRDYALQLSGFC